MGAGRRGIIAGLGDGLSLAGVKNLAIDFLVAGSVLYGVVKVYDIVSYYVSFTNNVVLTHCVIGYVTAKLYAYLRNG